MSTLYPLDKQKPCNCQLSYPVKPYERVHPLNEEHIVSARNTIFISLNFLGSGAIRNYFLPWSSQRSRDDIQTHSTLFVEFSYGILEGPNQNMKQLIPKQTTGDDKP